MSTFRTSDLLWLTIELNPLINNSSQLPSKPKNLSDLCSEKLISDVCLLHQKFAYIPKKIFSILLSKAIDKSRILSVVELIKCSPFEEIELSTPTALRDLSVIDLVGNYVEMCELKKFYDVSLSIFSAFLEVIGQRSCSSRLKTLNLGFVPMNKGILKLLKEFIEKSQKKCTKISMKTEKNLRFNPKDIKSFCKFYETSRNDLVQPLSLHGGYILKCALLVEEVSDLIDVLRCYLLGKTIDLQLIITGIFYYNIMCPDFLVSEIDKIINPQQFELLSVIFAEFLPRPEFIFSELKKFNNLKYLNMSHVRSAFCEQYLLQEFSVSLTELTNLKRLVLRNIELTGCLSYMFCKFCKKKLDSSIVTKCCLVHCGSLEYLDISGCRLSGEDIEFLKELPANNCLKYLDISDNSLSVTSTLQTLLFLSSSLLVLNMANCFCETVEYNPEIFPLSAFTQIRSLNIKGMEVTPRNKQKFYSELEKMVFECIKTNDEHPYNQISYEQFIAHRSQQ